MKILIATNFFKGSLSAIEAAEIIEKGILKTDNSIKVVKIPIADGGDGTLEAICNCTECKEILSKVNGPLIEKVDAKWLILEQADEKTAVIEGAQANGLSLIAPEQYNPLLTTTYGIGELIKQALDNECKKIYVTIGGSSTNDGGVGLLQALGASFLDKYKNEIAFGGGNIKNLKSIEFSKMDERLKDTKIIVACDVNNPLCGVNGASAVYGPQKGASEDDVKILDTNLTLLADITAQKFGKDYRNYPGTGAAGGIGFALKAFLNAELIPGFQLVAELSNMEEKMKAANLVITTEGKLDSQSLSGKAPYQVAQMAKKYNIPTIVIAGAVERNIDVQKAGITAAFCIADGPVTLKDSINNASELLLNITKQIMKLITCLKIQKLIL